MPDHTNEKVIFKNRADFLLKKTKDGKQLSPIEQREFELLKKRQAKSPGLTEEELQELRQITDQRRNSVGDGVDEELARELSSEYIRLQKRIAGGDSSAETRETFEELKSHMEKLKIPKHYQYYADATAEEKQARVEKADLYRRRQRKGLLTHEQNLRLQQLKVITQKDRFTPEQFYQTPEAWFREREPEQSKVQHSSVSSDVAPPPVVAEPREDLPPLPKKKYESFEYTQERVARKYGAHVLSRDLTRKQIAQLTDDEKRERNSYFQRESRNKPIEGHKPPSPTRILDQREFDEIPVPPGQLPGQYDKLKRKEDELIKQYGENVALKNPTIRQKELLGEVGLRARADFIKQKLDSLRWRRYVSTRDNPHLHQPDKELVTPFTETGNPRVGVVSSEVIQPSSSPHTVGLLDQAQAVPTPPNPDKFSHIPPHEIAQLVRDLSAGPQNYDLSDITDVVDPDPLDPNQMTPRDLLDFIKK